MSLGIFKKAFSTVQIEALKSYFSGIFAPAPTYKIYRALMTQSGTSAPTASIMENTIGDIVWTYSSTGNYYGTLTGAFTLAKYFTINAKNGFILLDTNGNSLGLYNTYRKSDNIVVLQSYNTSNAFTNSILVNAPIEIIVYN